MDSDLLSIIYAHARAYVQMAQEEVYVSFQFWISKRQYLSAYILIS